MNVLVTPESNPRELVLVKMLRYKCKRYKMRLEFLSLECPSLIKNALTLCQASSTPSMVPSPPPPWLISPPFRVLPVFKFIPDPKLL